MKIVVSIVSHGHQSLMNESGLIDLNKDLNIIVRENIPKAKKLISDNVLFFQNMRSCGFGANHNKNFECAELSDDDWFIICNPDIVVDSAQIIDFISIANGLNAKIAAPMLWNDNTKSFDHNVRPRITLTNLAMSFLGAPKRSRYDCAELERITDVQWASGAFLAIRAGLYREINGFDEKYFMYIEDVDLCDRARNKGNEIKYIKKIKITHNAARGNRDIFSKNFLYHIKSIIRYFFINKFTKLSNW